MYVQGAKQSLQWLRGTDRIDAEFQDIDTAMQQTSLSISITDLFRNRRVLKSLILSVLLMFFQQASGVNAVIFYTSHIFASAGYSSNPNIPTVTVGAVLVVFTLFSCIVSDVAGRRVLLLLSGTIMTASIATLGVYFFITEKHQVSLSLSLSVCLSVCIVSDVAGRRVLLLLSVTIMTDQFTD